MPFMATDPTGMMLGSLLGDYSDSASLDDSEWLGLWKWEWYLYDNRESGRDGGGGDLPPTNAQIMAAFKKLYNQYMNKHLFGFTRFAMPGLISNGLKSWLGMKYPNCADHALALEIYLNKHNPYPEHAEASAKMSYFRDDHADVAIRRKGSVGDDIGFFDPWYVTHMQLGWGGWLTQRYLFK
jgi:hypothetical protein